MEPNRGFIDRHLATAPASDYDQPWSFLALVVALEPGHAQFWKEKWRPRRWIAMTSLDVRMPTNAGTRQAATRERSTAPYSRRHERSRLQNCRN
jgi:hypothetical protein